jgi:hypothetical protein
MTSLKAYTIKHVLSAIFMAITLLWLTVSTSFVYSAQQKQLSAAKANSAQNADEDATNPFANTTEEKTPSSANLTEEYLHHHEEQVYFTTVKLNHTHRHSYNVYVAFHGELLSPPPEV